jgi:hypothetical protein
MPGAIWKGSINFGLVFIRASVYPATREEKISFKQLRATDLSPIKYKKVVEVDQKEVPADQIGKGYEFEKGKWVTLKDEDFEEVKIESTHFGRRAGADQSEVFLQTLLTGAAKKWREKLRGFPSRAVGHWQDRRREGRDFQPRIPCGGQIGWAVSDPGADALRA